MPLSRRPSDFEFPPDITYLNCAYMGPLSRRVQEAGVRGLCRKSQPWTIAPDDFFRDAERARDLFATLIGGDADGVALLPSVSYGIATAARNLVVPAGAEILVLAEQFPSNVYAWQELARRSGGRLRQVPRPADDDWTTAILAAVGPQTAIAALPHCHWTDGTLIDLETVGSELRRRNAALVIDGCQSIGALPFDVHRIQPDFLVTGSYKWLLGPYSHGFLWAAPRWRSAEPLEYNWIARANSHDFASLVRYTDEYLPGARRFDVGEVSNFALLPATLAALEQTLEWGVESVQEALQPLTERIAVAARALGLGVAAAERRCGHMVGLRLGGRDPRRLAEALAAARIFVSVRGDSVRVAPHVYNSPADVERFLDVLQGTLAAGSKPVPLRHDT